MSTIETLGRLLDRHAPEGRSETPVPRLALSRCSAQTLPNRMMYEPFVCFVAQGGKEVLLGEKLFRYRAGNYLVVTLDLPVSSTIVEADPRKPLLSASVSLDPTLIADILMAVPGDTVDKVPAAGLAVSNMTGDLLGAITRLVALLDTPQDIAMLAPLVERELLYRVIRSDQGGMLRQIALADSRLSQIGRVIAWIRSNYAETLRVETLAERAGMSTSSFHRHFKSATAMSPLQYQKQIRLQEARRLLLSHAGDATRVGFAVGYESPSQFSREYARLFGTPPGRDAAHLRELANSNPAALQRAMAQ